MYIHFDTHSHTAEICDTHSHSTYSKQSCCLIVYISVILTHIQHTACSAVVGSITYHILFSVNELQPKIISFLQPQVPVHFLQQYLSSSFGLSTDNGYSIQPHCYTLHPQGTYIHPTASLACEPIFFLPRLLATENKGCGAALPLPSPRVGLR